MMHPHPLSDSKKRRVLAISQKHLRTRHPARRLGARPRVGRRTRIVLICHHHKRLPPCCHVAIVAHRSALLKRGFQQHTFGSVDAGLWMPVSWNRSSSFQPFRQAGDARSPRPVDPVCTAWRDTRRRLLSLLPTLQIPSRARWEAEGVGAALHGPVRSPSSLASHDPVSEGPSAIPVQEAAKPRARSALQPPRAPDLPAERRCCRRLEDRHRQTVSLPGPTGWGRSTCARQLPQLSWQLEACVYRESKSERIDDEVRPVWRANL
jgi:hypothetical protein